MKIKITNNFPKPIILWLEPWGEDYGMMPGDEFEIIPIDAGEDFHFHLAFTDKDIRVYVEGQALYAQIYHNGKIIECGHNRFWEYKE